MVSEKWPSAEALFQHEWQKYKELDLKQRLESMSEDEQLELLSSDGMLVKRPLLIRGRFGTCRV